MTGFDNQKNMFKKQKRVPCICDENAKNFYKGYSYEEVIGTPALIFEMLNLRGGKTVIQAYALVQALCYSISIVDSYIDYIYYRTEMDVEDIVLDLYNVLSELVMQFGLCPRSVGISIMSGNRFRPFWAAYHFSGRVKVPLDKPMSYEVKFCPGELSHTLRAKIVTPYRYSIQQTLKDRMSGVPSGILDDHLCSWMTDVLNNDSPCSCQFLACDVEIVEKEAEIAPLVVEVVASVAEFDQDQYLSDLLDSCLEEVMRNDVDLDEVGKSDLVVEEFRQLCQKRNYDLLDTTFEDELFGDNQIICSEGKLKGNCNNSLILGFDWKPEVDIKVFPSIKAVPNGDYWQDKKTRNKIEFRGEKKRISNARQKVKDARRIRRAKKREGLILPKQVPALVSKGKTNNIGDGLDHPIVIPVLGQWNFIYVDDGVGLTVGYELLPAEQVKIYVPAIKQFLKYRKYVLMHPDSNNIIDVYLSMTLFHNYEELFHRYLSQFPVELIMGGLLPKTVGFYAGKCKCDFLHQFCAKFCYYVPDGEIEIFAPDLFGRIINPGVRCATDTQLYKLLIVAKKMNIRINSLWPGIELSLDVLEQNFYNVFFELFRYHSSTELFWLDMLQKFKKKPVLYERAYSAWLYILVIWEYANFICVRGGWSRDVFVSFIYDTYVKIIKHSTFRIPSFNVDWVLGV